MVNVTEWRNATWLNAILECKEREQECKQECE